MSPHLISIVVPCFREGKNIPILFARICAALSAVDFGWELLLVDDHSPDNTYEAAVTLAEQDGRVRVLRLARNCGSHIAAAAGLKMALGDAAVIIAADLQDPPEVIPELVAKWQDGNQVVWACRKERHGVGLFGKMASAMYNGLIASIVPHNKLPPQGADFLLIDRKVMTTLATCEENRPNIFALVLWLGYSQSSISYTKAERLHGESGWTFRRKLRFLVDSITAFSDFPLRLMSVTGFVVAFSGFAYAIYITVRYFMSLVQVEGWASLMVVVLVLSGVQMMMLGVIGEYLWRTLGESRGRPRYSIEKSYGRMMGSELLPDVPVDDRGRDG